MSLEPWYIENQYCITNSDNHWWLVNKILCFTMSNEVTSLLDLGAKDIYFMATNWKAIITSTNSSKRFRSSFPSKPAFQYISAKENQESENVTAHNHELRYK
jgi:hypothetical protein